MSIKQSLLNERVCFFSHSSDLWGAERSLLDIVTEFKKRDVFCLVIVPSKGPLCDQLNEIGVEYIVSSYGHWVSKNHPIVTRVNRWLKYWGLSFILAYRLKGYRFTCIYTNTIVIPIGAFVAKRLGCRHIWHIREYGLEHHQLVFDWGSSFSYRFIDQHSDHIIAVSHAVKDYLSTYINCSISVIYNTVPLSFSIPPIQMVCSSWHPLRCIVVGNINQSKRQWDVIQAIRCLQIDHQLSIQLSIVGSGEPKEIQRIQDYIITHNLNNIVFTGYLLNSLSAINDSHLLIVPSMYEASPRVTVEAMRLSKPVISTDSGGAPEHVLASGCGLVFKTGDIDGLIEQLLYAYYHPEAMIEKGQKGKLYVEQYLTKSCFFSLLEEVFNCMLKNMK